jgi:hypothetical protein
MAQSRTDITFGALGRGFQIGINSGPIHLPPGTSQPAKPIMLNATPHRATGNTTKSVIYGSLPPRSRLRRSTGSARAGLREMFYTCVSGCTCGYRRGRVSLKIRLILSLPMSNPSKGSRNLLSNTLTRLETDYQIPGFFGSTRVTQLASSRAIGRLLTA